MVTAKQIAALKYMIFESKDGTGLSKRILTFLIDQSENLRKEVCLTLVEGREEYNADEINGASYGVNTMQSSHGTTHLNELLYLMGSELAFSVHYGNYDPSRAEDAFNKDGMFAGLSKEIVNRPELLRGNMPLRYTFWLSKEWYSRKAHLVVATRGELEQIDLTKPGLYPKIESTRT